MMRKLPKNKRLYKKALEILVLSNRISNCLAYDLSSLEKDGSENPFIYFTGDLIRHSNALASQIVLTENLQHKDERLKHASKLMMITRKLYRNCDRLERSRSNYKDFIIVLRRELKKFQKLQHFWILTL